jgi:16S rRNA (cytosine1402-N4)-methyltransferase
MVAEVLAWTGARPGAIVADLTLGTGGHALALGERIGPGGLLLGLDRDPEALAAARARLEREARFPWRLVCAPFSRIGEVARAEGIEGFDVVLADLGVGSHQLARAERGFSFSQEGPLDLRYDRSGGAPSAAEVVATLSEAELADIFFRYGEERWSRPIARAICREREQREIRTTLELAGIVTRVVGAKTQGRRLRLHPATRVMQALRIYVNDELGELERLLGALPALLRPGGRAAIQCYHSLESRAVKTAWREQARAGRLRELKGSPVRPGEAEVRANPRVRSVQMRVAERVSGVRAGRAQRGGRGR